MEVLIEILNRILFDKIGKPLDSKGSNGEFVLMMYGPSSFGLVEGDITHVRLSSELSKYLNLERYVYNALWRSFERIGNKELLAVIETDYASIAHFVKYLNETVCSIDPLEVNGANDAESNSIVIHEMSTHLNITSISGEREVKYDADLRLMERNVVKSILEMQMDELNHLNSRVATLTAAIENTKKWS